MQGSTQAETGFWRMCIHTASTQAERHYLARVGALDLLQGNSIRPGVDFRLLAPAGRHFAVLLHESLDDVLELVVFQSGTSMLVRQEFR